MDKTLIEIKDKNLEKGYGTSAKEIAKCIGKDPAFDEKVTQTSPRRFQEIMSTYKKEAMQESKAALNSLLSKGGKVFKDTNDYYLANRCVGELTIEALEQGSFRIPGEKDSCDKANKAYTVLMQYLTEIDSPHADTLSSIRIDEPEETVTVDKFIDSKKENVREAFSSYRGEEYTVERFNSIFSKIKKLVKARYEQFTKDEARRVKKGEPLLSSTQKINLLIKDMNKQTEQRNEAVANIGKTNKEKAQYANILTQKHNFFHKK